jgi:hypothetical protein
MASFHKLTLNFNAGELSPFLTSRTDIAKYESGCQRLENFIILPYGGVIRRPGTQWLGRAKYPDKQCRMIGFNFSVTTNFMLEFGDKYIRFWTNGIPVSKPVAAVAGWITAHAYVVGDYVMQSATMYYCKIAHTSGTFATDLTAGKWVQQVILERPTPYLEADLREIQYCQINDLMYLVHPNYPPAKLRRLADDNWTYAAIAWKWPPVLEENVTAITIDPSASTGNITLVASGDLWGSPHVGSYWTIGIHRETAFSQVALGATDGIGGGVYVLGAWSLTTYGTWQGTVFVEKAMPDGTWDVLRSWTSGAVGERNVASSGKEETPATLRLRFQSAAQAGSSNPEARLEVADNLQYGFVKITAVTDARHASATVIAGLPTVAPTTIWAEGAFSAQQGYPRTVCLHDSRLIYGGTFSKPLSLHGSSIDDYENFRQGAAADQAFYFNISANESNPINWQVSQTKLLVGTAGDEWAVGATNTDQALGPGNVNAKQQSSFGSSYLQARVINEVVLFSQRQSHKIRELTFSFEKDGWVAPDLTILAAHISGKGFAETAFAQQPDAIFWSITQDGKLIGMTYERDQNVVGWHRHSTDGEFESVGTIYGGEKADEVWFSVKRTINGQDVRYIERFDPNFRLTFEEEDKDYYWYLDCGFRSSGASEVTTVSGIGHLEGKTVGILGDGANQPTRVVTGGQLTIQEPAKIILAGLPYSSTVKPMNLNIPSNDTMQGRKVRIHRMVVRLYKSLTCKFSSDDINWDEVFFRDRDDHMDDSPNVFTGDREVSTGANFSTQQAMALRQDRPFPLCVLAMILWTNFYGE